MIEISSLAHTWILDIDGTLVKHNGNKIDGFIYMSKDIIMQLQIESLNC